MPTIVPIAVGTPFMKLYTQAVKILSTICNLVMYTTLVLTADITIDKPK